MHLSSSMKRIIAVVYLPLAIIYLYLSYIYPTDSITIADHHLNLTEARIIALTFASLFVVIWLVTFYAAREFVAYCRCINQYKDGDAFLMLAWGLLVIAAYVPIRSISKIVLDYITHLHPAFTATSNMIITYINILIPLVVFGYISIGGSKLHSMVRSKIPTAHVSILALILCTVAATYCYAAFSPTPKVTPTDWLVIIDYNIAMPLRIFTVVVPHLYMWAVGLIATYQIYFYQQKIRGIIYKESLKLLSAGLTLVIVVTMAIQYLNAIASSVLRQPTGVMLLFAVVIFGIVMVAYALIVKGVSRLRVFEELL